MGGVKSMFDLRGRLLVLALIALSSVLIVLFFQAGQAGAAVASSGFLNNASGENPFTIPLSSYDGEDGFSITRPNHYEYAPSVVKVSSNTVRMWFCGGGSTSSLGGDSVWYTQSTDFGRWGTWSNPVEVIRASNNYSYLDYAHACDPSVVMHDNFYYIAYTGAPDWRNAGRPTAQKVSVQCPADNAVGCDNRIFMARVPVSSPQTKTSYQKLVNVGECPSASCFQWQPFWTGTEYPPVPYIRYEIGSVWRRVGTGVSGYTGPQTSSYGIGQPSHVNIGEYRIWFTDVKGSSASVKLWRTAYPNIGSGYNVQNPSSYNRITSNVGNDVNYDVAFEANINRYAATISRQNPDLTGRPCVHVSQYTGSSTAGFTAPIISNNLWDQSTCFLAAESNAHNTGFLRDSYGNLVRMSGHNGGPQYNWVYYGTNINQIHTNGGAVNINRVPFTF